MAERDCDQTLRKFTEGEMSGEASQSVSESSQSEISNNCSLLSGSRSEFSVRTGSEVPLQPQFSISSRNYHSRPPLPLPPSRCGNSTRTRRCSSRSTSHHHSSRSTSRHRRTSRPSPFLQRRFLIVITLISITFSVVTCGITALCFVYKFVPSEDDHTFKNGDYKICLPCATLLNNTGQSRAVISRLISSSNNGDCCASNSGELSDLLEIIINKQKNKTAVPAPVKQKYRSRPVSAHRSLKPFENVEQVCETTPCHIKLNTDSCEQQNHGGDCKQHSHSVWIRNNTLLAEISGCYFIYSSIYFKPRSQIPCSQLPNQTFKHSVSLIRPHTLSNTSILETAHHCCDDCTADRHTSYTGGVFKLRKNDQIFIKVSGSGKVLFDEDTSYLGLVLLDNSTACVSDE